MATGGVDGIVDVVGVGFGPSNLGLAIALEEHHQQAGAVPLSAVFVESRDRFAWHPDMLLPGTTMQISFLKDLATLRNERSAYTFLSYLADRGRLVHFVNHQTFFPTRREFHDYLCWAAERVAADVRYGTRAESVRWDGDHFRVACSDGRVLRGRNVVLAGGLAERLPAGVTPGPRVFHNHRLLEHLGAMPEPRHGRFVVVGAGQSGAEVAGYLHSTYPDAAVHAVFGKYGYSPSDDSPYANRVFDPDAVDDFYAAPPAVRRRLLDYHHATNYSAVDLDLIEELYAREYAERVTGRRRLFVEGASEAAEVRPGDTGVRVRLRRLTTGRITEMDCDAVVYATGFEPMDVTGILGDQAAEVRMEAGAPAVLRDYRLSTTDRIGGGIYLQGPTEHTHGLTSSLLSNVAVRSGEIVDSLAGRAQRRAPVPGARDEAALASQSA